MKVIASGKQLHVRCRFERSVSVAVDCFGKSAQGPLEARPNHCFRAVFQTERVSFYPSNSGPKDLALSVRRSSARLVESTKHGWRGKKSTAPELNGCLLASLCITGTLLTLVGRNALRFQDGPSVPKKRCKTASSESERKVARAWEAFLLSQDASCLLPQPGTEGNLSGA